MKNVHKSQLYFYFATKSKTYFFLNFQMHRTHIFHLKKKSKTFWKQKNSRNFFRSFHCIILFIVYIRRQLKLYYNKFWTILGCILDQNVTTVYSLFYFFFAFFFFFKFEFECLRRENTLVSSAVQITTNKV